METQQPEWHVDVSHASKGEFKRFAKKRQREYDSLFANLDKIMVLLRCGNKIGGFQVGFLRSEAEGVFRIGQTGVANAKESRLYVYPDEQSCSMYVLHIGTKETQHDDINASKAIVKAIRAATKTI